VTLAGAVVLYNPDNSVWDNINTYLSEVEVLYAVDNSEIYNEVLIEKIKNNSKIRYINNDRNLGIASALNIGARSALGNKYEWLLTMDQDSSFNDSSYFRAFDEYENKERIALFSPTHYQSQNSHRDNIINSFATIVMTSGNILNLKAYTAIGGFTEKLFIDEIDHDYCLRAILKGFSIIQCNIELKHTLGKPVYKNGKEITIHNNVRIYYITRNNLYIWKKYFIKFPVLILKRIRWYIEYAYNNISYSKKKSVTIKFMLKGFSHFACGRYGQL
jgi:rhamnosyltransferase